MFDKQQQQSLIPKKKIEHYTYLMHDQIGKGYSSKVFKGKDENSGEQVAIKVIDMKAISNEVEKQLVQQEIAALKLLAESANIVKLLDYYQTNNNTYIITEFCNNGDLGTLIQKNGCISEVEAQKILKHIINGFKDQINKGVIHRDIKPANILIKEKIPKIADYGFSKMTKSKDKVVYRVGTPVYMSPESFLENRYSEKSDIWSIGVVYYEMLYGQCPWVINKESEFQESTSQLRFNRNIPVSEESKEFLRRALEVNEQKRLSLFELEQQPLFTRRNTTNFNKPRAPLTSNSFNRSIAHLNMVRVNQTQQCGPRSGSTNKPLTSPERKEATHKPQRSLQIEKFGLVIQHQNKSVHFDSATEELITNQFNQCVFLNRMCQLLEHYHPNTKLRTRQISNFARENLEILEKLKEVHERGVNAFRLVNFNAQAASLALSKLKFKESYQQQKDYCARFTDYGEPCVRELIRELNHNVRLRLSNFSEASVLLLDYLVYYFQCTDKRLGCLFGDGKPIEITQNHYHELRTKIFNLNI